MPGLPRNIIAKLRAWADLPSDTAPVEEQCARLQRQMGIDDHAPLTVVKQYGEYRTGSNALRALVLENFDNALVLMHLLGDKHHDAADYENLAKALSGCGTDQLSAILDATWARHGGLTRPENFRQLAFARAFYKPVASSITDGTLRALLTVRHPLTWVEAVMRFWEWPAQPAADPWLKGQWIGLANRLCRRFNVRYAGWLKLREKFGGRAIIVPFEAIEADWSGVVESLASAFPLHLRRGHPVKSARRVEPSPWANAPPCYSKAKQRRHASTRPRVHPELEEIVNREIDWGLLERLGYTREPGGVVRVRPGIQLAVRSV